MCQRQSSLGSALAMAQVMPPWADTVWERVGNTWVITAVLKPDGAICSAARIPAPPPPTTMPSKLIVRILAISSKPPQNFKTPNEVRQGHYGVSPQRQRAQRQRLGAHHAFGHIVGQYCP